MWDGSLKRSMAVSDMVFAATIMPFAPIDVPPAATACQVWAAVPGTQVVVMSNGGFGGLHGKLAEALS